MRYLLILALLMVPTIAVTQELEWWVPSKSFDDWHISQPDTIAKPGIIGVRAFTWLQGEVPSDVAFLRDTFALIFACVAQAGSGFGVGLAVPGVNEPFTVRYRIDMHTASPNMQWDGYNGQELPGFTRSAYLWMPDDQMTPFLTMAKAGSVLLIEINDTEFKFSLNGFTAATSELPCTSWKVRRGQSMFLEAVAAGLGVLLNWEIWVGAVVYMIAMLGYMYWTSKVTENDPGSGCLLQVVGGTVVQGMLMSLYVGIFLPTILFRGSPTFPPSFGQLFLAGAAATVTLMIASSIPFVGSFIGNVPGVQGLIIGVTVFRFYGVGVMDLGTVTYPGLLASLGFLATATLFSLLAVALMAVVSTVKQAHIDKLESVELGEQVRVFVESGLLQTVAVSTFGVVGGLLPFFMYVQYVLLAS